jgi:DNA ligase 1
MLLFSQTADRIAATTKKLEKTAILAQYLGYASVDEAAVAAVFFSGRPFPVWEETTLQVGGSLLWRIVAELSGRPEHEITAAYRKHGDLGAVAEAVLSHEEVLTRKDEWSDGRPRPSKISQKNASHSLADVQHVFREISVARGPAAKGFLVRQLLSEVSPLEAKYIIKIMTGDLRIGLKESLVEEAIAKAFAAPEADGAGVTLKAVQRANMLLGDIGQTLKLAAEGRLAQARMRLFHPIGFMLASPAESAEDALSYFQNAWVEDKFDGIRAQAHCSVETVRFFSRTRDEITESFPELPDALAGLPHDAILDGEIVAWDYVDATDDSADAASYVVRRASSANLTQAKSGVASHVVPHAYFNSGDQAPEERTSLAQRGSAGKKGSLDSSPGGTAETGVHDIVVPNSYGRALPFTALQQRLGRKKVSEKLIRDVPVAYLVFDVLYANGELLIDLPLRERAKILDDLLANRRAVHHGDTEARRKARLKPEVQGALLFAPPFTDSQEPRAGSRFPTTDDREPMASIIRAPVFQAASPGELNALFDAAQDRGNEGLMIKDAESSYTPGRRGKSWLKLKRELATLDVVVTAVEYGHGRRIGVLSDYTFAVRDGGRLLNVGKAYSGLTDAEIAEMTKWFLAHTIEDQGFRRTVEPKIVLEVAFNNVMKSNRHGSGYALRFPRIVRLRPDKLPEEIDTLERVNEIYERQGQ